jgi:hypothetical protein
MTPSKTISTITRDVRKLEEPTGNLYESIAIISKRANHLSEKLKEEMTDELSHFDHSDSIEEISENREQIEMAMKYERMTKPHVLATEEFLNNKLFFKNPNKK